MSKLRFQAFREACSHSPKTVAVPNERPDKFFGKLVFTREKMKGYIADTMLNQLFDAIDNGKPLSRDIANSVAMGMKKWASELGATHYTHWFQPLTGGTAEKHDAFLDKTPEGHVLEEFSGKVLYQQEPDASSFPNGGIRNTFEARGYSAWDPTSPAFIVGDTLCIPTIFVAYTGEALDYKTPLIKSISAVSKAAVDVCRYFDRNVSKVTVFLGWEQEYFLVDKSLWLARPDLMLTGRTLMGHDSAKNQQLGDHYFGSIPERVLHFMTDLEIESLKLGIPVKTRHNEVAPNQFELAPIYEEANLANDHNLLLMSLMERIAHRHHFRVLLHEKPFAGVNGSGKHCNWSLATNTGVNLLAPGKNAAANLQFVTFLVNVLMAVYKHNGLLKASISSATNAHRLGANEAPPAIISVFLGKQLTDVLDKLEKASIDKGIAINAKKEMKLGVATIPEILLDNTDRNRTSPFAFTGNRFEFRAVGASANCGDAMLTLNAAVADQLINFKKEVDKRIEKGEPKERALFAVIKKYIADCKAIRFDGNSYSDAWKKEAAERGLDCETNVPLIFDRYLSPESIAMFKNTNVLSEAELQSRCEVKWDTYTKKIQIESRVLGDLVMNHIVPVANSYQSILLENVVRMKEAFDADEAKKLSAQDIVIIRRIAEHITTIVEKADEMLNLRREANHKIGERTKAIAYHDNIVPLMEEIRHHVDKLEMIVDDEMWTLPKYRELMFIK
ncbi:MAG TPA: glutamine synthetase III [Paludibacteraceae bacterium]|jgi:glutamine synthetase|nr:glutamine synthetase type III [Bacteroidales bacterium]HOG36229.1 glutamine synthetase III [Paludibacteraceae bacterium]HOS37065.1 glutamine synthetase III [Paludibacteraceae bacterium]HPD26918.1 glutamine synthetase III [Paludibacteraceae bacterium]HPK19970.1 glutamine synthetase III [Paludibacteraceae bacterium]